MKVLRIQPKKYPEVIEIDGSLESLQKEVAGLIQAVYPWDDPVALICNEEMDGRGRYQEHLQRQLDIHERGNCRSISCSRKQRD